MTREEIIDFCEMKSQLEPENEDIFDYIIKALEQEPSADCVSRKQAQFMITNGKYPDEDYVQFIDRLVKELENMPSVTHTEQKTGHWIRVDKTKVKCSACEVIHMIAQYPNAKISWCPNCGAKMIEPQEYKNKKCEDCTEWEYFDGYGHGCFCMKTMTPIDANKCEFYADKRPDIPQSWKPSKVEPQALIGNEVEE